MKIKLFVHRGHEILLGKVNMISDIYINDRNKRKKHRYRSNREKHRDRTNRKKQN